MNNEEQNYTDAQLLRIKAEKQLKENKKALEFSVLESDVKKLMHELQVHQIELEMQNEELIKANEIAEEALKKYTMLYDFAPMGYYTLEPDGSIDELNFTGAEMLGDKRVSLTGTNFKLFVSDDSKSVFSKFFKKVFSSKAKESCEIRLGYENERLKSVYMEGIVLSGDSKCLLSVVDISPFRKQKTEK
jgi:PAS domain-containing protein